MKRFFSGLLKVVCIAIVIALGVLLILKIKDDTLIQKNMYEETQNIQVESEYMLGIANDKIAKIKEEIEKAINTKIEVADSGSISQIDLYFVAKVEEDYRYIIKKIDEDGTEVFAISKDNNENGRYIVSLEAIGLDECMYTDLADYSIDNQGVITYTNNK